MRYLAVLLLLAGSEATVSSGEATRPKLERLKRAIQEATASCAKEGKKMQVVRDVRGYGSPGYTATLTFACTDK